jgi:gluconokinase
LTFETTPLDLRQAGLEGVAFRFADVAEGMPGLEEVVVTGGALLRDPDWVQIMADALGRPLTTSGVREGSLRGAAVLALERLGASPAPAPLGAVIEPRPQKVEVFRAARERQRRLYEVVTGSLTS